MGKVRPVAVPRRNGNAEEVKNNNQRPKTFFVPLWPLWLNPALSWSYYIGAKIVRHAGYVVFQMAEVALPST